MSTKSHIPTWLTVQYDLKHILSPLKEMIDCTFSLENVPEYTPIGALLPPPHYYAFPIEPQFPG